MKHQVLIIVALLFMGVFQTGSGCTKVVVYAQEYQTDPMDKTYSTNVPLALEQAKQAMENMGFQILRMDESRSRVVSGWMPVLSNSHFLTLFKKRDYSASLGSYYQLVSDVFLEGNHVKVSVRTNVKSLAGQLDSAFVVEKKYISILDNLMRRPVIDLTNVGMKER